MTYSIIWEFRVVAAQRPRFEAVYAADGDWAKLFGQSHGYHGTQLLKCADEQGRYVTIDTWDSRDAFLAFRREHAEAYAGLDRDCEPLCVSEKPLGGFIN